MERGRYTNYSKTRLPRRRRSKQLSGSFEDHGKWIRCWNCGFIINLDRDLGDPERSGNYQTEVIIPSPSPAGSGTTPLSMFDSLSMIGNMIGLDNTGSAITDYYTPRNSEVAKGCPLCGTNNFP